MGEDLPKCFVIQPFSVKFQKLYQDVFKDAIIAADLEPYKVDEDSSASIPIEAIERNIKNADVCFADISETNANVWYELGFAISSGKGVCIICAKQSLDRLPFDVQHRSVIFYDNESPSDFIALKGKVTSRLSALKSELKFIEVTNEDSDGHIPGIDLKEHELTTLAVIASQQDGSEGTISISSARDGVGRAGYNEVAAALALHALQRKLLIEEVEEYTGVGDSYRACKLTSKGWERLQENEDRLQLKKASAKRKGSDFDDEIPF